MHYPVSDRLVLFIKLLLFILLIPPGLHAQGFVHFYPDSTEAFQINERPGAYELLSRKAPAEFWTRQRTDTDGRLIGDAQQFPTFQAQPLRNGDYLSNEFQSGDTVLVLRRQNQAGNTLWEYQFSLGESNERATDAIRLRESADGDLYVSGYFEQEYDLTIDAFILKLNASGQFVWSDTLDNAEVFLLDVAYFDLQPAPGGECLILQTDDNNTSWTLLDDTSTITRKSADGTETAHFGAHAFYYNNGETYTGILPDGRVYEFIAEPFPNGPFSNFRLRTFDDAGAILTETNLTDMFQAALNDDPAFSIAKPLMDGEGNFLLYMSTQQGVYKHLLAKIKPEGPLIWSRELPQLSAKSTVVREMRSFSDGSTGITGNWAQAGDEQQQLLFAKIGPDGALYAYSLTGNVAQDANGNCLAEPTEPPLPGWLLQVKNESETWFTATDADGKYSLQADTGTYQLSLTAPGYLWEICDNPQTVTVNTDPNTTEYATDFSVAALADCPYMQVDIAAAYLQAGVDNTYSVRYCNLGSAAAADVVISIEPDPALTFQSASIPFTLNDGLIEFHPGNVAAGDCGQFTLVLEATDDPEWYGQSVCVTARIRPDSICLPGFAGWSGALLEARGACDGDSVRFEIRNIGHQPSTPGLEYIIADDHVIMYQGQLPVLQPEGLLAFAAPASGASWRFIAEQEPHAPAGVMPSVQVEGCATAGSMITKGLLVQTPNQTGSPFSDTECHILFSGGQAPALSASPVGIPPQNLIEASTEIEYTVHFHSENPVSQVVITDSLPAHLDMNTIVPGPSTHAYNWNIGADGALRFYLEDSTNGLQEGFVQFAVKPDPAVPQGTVITNRAAVQFGSLEPEITNSVFYTIGKDTLSGIFSPAHVQLPAMAVSPNPASELAQVRLPFEAAPGTTLLLRNVLGQKIREYSVTDNTCTIPRGNLPGGVYLLECRRQGKVLAGGRLVWQ